MNHSRHDKMYGEIKLFGGTASPELTQKIALYLNIEQSGRDIIQFPNDDLFIKLHHSVRGQDCYVIQTTSHPVHRNLMELLILLQTLRLDSASRVTAVVPYLCYARSDKKDQPRVPITARLVADLIVTAGADRYITLDLHAGQIQGFFSIPGDMLTAFHILLGYLNSVKGSMSNPVVVTADLGFAKKGRNFAAGMDTPLAFIEKRRVANDTRAEALTIIGDVSGRDCVLIDDELLTGGTMEQAVRLLKEKGAGKITMVFVHPVLAANAAARMAALPVHEFVTTDSIPIPAEKVAVFGGRLTVLTVSSLLAEVILRANEGRSVGEMFNE